MSYAGTVLDMINRMKANMAMKKARREKMWDKAALLEPKAAKGTLSEKFAEEVSPAIKAQRKRDTQALIDNANKRRHRALAIALVVMVAIILFFVFYN